MVVFIRNGISMLKPHPHSVLGMCGRYILFLCLVASWQQSQAQTAFAPATNSFTPKPLSIGDKIPDELWNMPLQVVNHPQGKNTITLSEYKDKLIILDFWSTWCAPCIKNFPKLNALQDQFGDKLKVLAVTQEDTEKITKFFKSGAGKEHTYVNSVIDDSVLSEYFPHRTVPHIAWINPDGRLLNTTQGEDITQANIQSILGNKKTQMVTKVDIDRNRPLFLSEHFSSDLQLKNYSIFVKGYYTGLPSGNNFKKTKEGKIYGRQMTNTTMMRIYYPILSSLFEMNGEQFNSKRMIIEVKESALLDVIKKADEKSERYNLYNYELIIPEDKADSLYYYMLADLNRYSDYIGSIEKRMVDCLVLIRTSTKDKIKSKGGKSKNTFPASPSIITNQKLDAMINMISEEKSITQLIVDETGYKDNVNIEVSGIKDLASFKKELNRYDLDLIPAKRNLNMFVLKDK